jgi:pyruvate dehydrogenase (quinone)
MVGTSFPYIEFFPKPGQARGVQIDVNPTRIGLRYPVEVGLVGDSQLTLRKLVPLLKRNEDRSFLKKAQEGMSEWWKLMEERGTRKDKPMKPQVVAWELGKRLAPDAIVAADSGTIATWFARQIPASRGQKFSLSGNLATMANGLPYTIAAQVAYPERQCIGFVGDGGFSMLMAEFSTAVKYRLPIKIIVVKNNTLGQIKWEQIVFLGNPEFGCDLLPIDFAAFARACSGSGFTIEDPADCGSILDEAACDPRSRCCGGRSRSVDSPDAGKSHFGSGNEIRRIPNSRTAGPFQNRLDGSIGQDTRAYLASNSFGQTPIHSSFQEGFTAKGSSSKRPERVRPKPGN